MPSTLRMGRNGLPVPGSAANEDDQETTVAIAGKGPTSRAKRCPTCSQAFSGEARFCPFDGDPLVAAPDWNPAADALLGQTIDGRYEVLSVLGEGGMGTVYEVRHTSLDRHFAMKVLRRDVAEDADLAERFAREAKAAASIGHPNIVAVNDFGELPVRPVAGRKKRVPYFVMELLHGTTLGVVLKQEGKLSPARGAAIALQCASALEAAHEAGVLHRDLKPDNVFLIETSGREFVKLLDFGVAKIAGLGRLTRAGRVFGTPHYMSPEQAAGREIDYRADVYSLGVILYECFGGRVPFEADTYMGVLTQHMFAVPAPLDRVVASPGDLGGLGPIVMRCLEKKPEDRFQSMAELGQAIEQVLEHPEGLASAAKDAVRTLNLREPEAEGARGSMPLPDVAVASRRPWALAAGAAALLAASVVVAWGAGRSDESPVAPPVASAAEESHSAAPVGTAATALSPTPSSAVSAPPAALPDPAPASSPSTRATGDRGTPAAKPRAPSFPSTPKPDTRSTPRATEVVDPWK